MRMLKFAVEGQQLAKRGDFAGVTAGSKGYLRCHFEQSDPEWLMAKKIAVFNDEYAVTVSAEGEHQHHHLPPQAHEYAVGVHQEQGGKRICGQEPHPQLCWFRFCGRLGQQCRQTRYSNSGQCDETGIYHRRQAGGLHSLAGQGCTGQRRFY